MSHLKIEISGGINSLTEIGAKICVQGYTQYEPVSVSHQRGARRRATGLVTVKTRKPGLGKPVELSTRQEGVMPGAVGKRELLAWAADTSELPCTRLEDLKSGVVLLALLYKIFPKLIDRKLRMRWAPKFDHEQTMNWDAIEHAIALLRLPSELFDREGLQACRFRPTYKVRASFSRSRRLRVSGPVWRPPPRLGFYGR